MGSGPPHNIQPDFRRLAPEPRNLGVGGISGDADAPSRVRGEDLVLDAELVERIHVYGEHRLTRRCPGHVIHQVKVERRVEHHGQGLARDSSIGPKKETPPAIGDIADRDAQARPNLEARLGLGARRDQESKTKDQRRSENDESLHEW